MSEAVSINADEELSEVRELDGCLGAGLSL
jgi:hypothetical protein